jgi:hypothetical protein
MYSIVLLAAYYFQTLTSATCDILPYMYWKDTEKFYGYNLWRVRILTNSKSEIKVG